MTAYTAMLEATVKPYLTAVRLVLRFSQPVREVLERFKEHDDTISFMKGKKVGEQSDW